MTLKDQYESRKTHDPKFPWHSTVEPIVYGHTLMVGTYNVGKSTICEALDLVLGPDRLNRFPPIDEHDFYNGFYLTAPLAAEQLSRPPLMTRFAEIAQGVVLVGMRRWDVFKFT